jgi:hypothetical protein
MSIDLNIGWHGHVAMNERRTWTNENDDKRSAMSNTRTTIRPSQFRYGPQSAFARLFPDEYRRQQQEIFTYYSAMSDNHRQMTTIDGNDQQDRFNDDNDDKSTLRQPMRIRFAIENRKQNHLQARIDCEQRHDRSTDYQHDHCSQERSYRSMMHSSNSHRLGSTTNLNVSHGRTSPVTYRVRPSSSTSPDYSRRTVPMNKPSIVCANHALRRVVHTRLPPLRVEPRVLKFDKCSTKTMKDEHLKSFDHIPRHCQSIDKQIEQEFDNRYRLSFVDNRQYSDNCQSNVNMRTRIPSISYENLSHYDYPRHTASDRCHQIVNSIYSTLTEHHYDIPRLDDDNN